jgi:nucleoside-diphosphate-sugar epimerase
VKVFVAGASGALGMPVVRALRRRGHEVVGTTRRPDRAEAISGLGAQAVLADAMDSKSIEAAVRTAEPEVVVDLLTALPKSGPMRVAEMRATNELRRIGSDNLLEACARVRARRYVAESFYLIYGSGDLGNRPLTEDVSVPIKVAHPSLTDVVSAIQAKESRTLAAAASGKVEGIVLRFGGFYGFGAGLENMVEMLRKRRLPVVNSRNATPWIQIDDAAEGVVAAVERGSPGEVYNIADDEPRPLADVLRTMAEFAGAPRPIAVPGFVFQLFAPMLKAVLIDSNIRLSNEKAKATLGWAPRYATVRSGLSSMLATRRPGVRVSGA